MQRSCCKLHSQFIGNFIQRDKIFTVHILNSHSKSHIRMPHLHQLLQRTISAVKTIRYSTNSVIGFLKSFYTDSDPYFRKFLAQFNDPVGKISISRNHNSIRLFIKFSDNFRDILPNKRLSTSNIGKRHLRKLFNYIKRNFILRPRWIPKTITHITVSVTSIGYNNCTVKGSFRHFSILSF